MKEFILTSQYQYPYDPTGTQPSNFVTDLPHPLTPVQGRGYSLIVPKAGPFFKNDFKLVHKSSGDVLTPDVDYVFTHLVLDISQALQLNVYGSVTIVNQRIMGEVIPSYYTVGGEYTLDESKFAQYAIHLLESDGAYPWDKLTDIPQEFPPSSHDVPIGTTAGYDELIDVIKKISLGGDHMHNINNVRHLDDILNNKLDSNGNYKVLTSANFHVHNTFIGSVHCRLPKVKTQCLIKTKLQIIENNTVKTLEVTGSVRSYNDGVIPERWMDARISPAYDCWDGDLYMTYDSEHYPVIILGDGKEWVNAHISIVDYFTVNPEEIEGEVNPFRVSIATSLQGLTYTNTNAEGHVLTPNDTVGELASVVSSRYRGIIPSGIYQGYTISLMANNQIRVGNPNGLNSAVVNNGTDAVTILLNNDSQILTLEGPQYKTVVLEFMTIGQPGDTRFELDLPNREARITLVEQQNVLGNMLVLGEVNWPGSDPALTVDHLTYEGRDTASWNPGEFIPISSEVI